jgi:electron transport complex protein RnfG
MMQKAGTILRSAFVLAVVCLVSIILLWATYRLMWERIAEPAELDKLAAAFAQIFPHAELKAMNDYYEVFKNGEVIGYAATAQGMGFKGPIELALGIGVDGTIRGVRIIAHVETPGLWDKPTEEEFLRQFEGKKHLEEVRLTRDRGAIHAMTGATVTSDAITTAVRDKVMELMELITERTPQ